jgi:hypothetical protein
MREVLAQGADLLTIFNAPFAILCDGAISMTGWTAVRIDRSESRNAREKSCVNRAFALSARGKSCSDRSESRRNVHSRVFFDISRKWHPPESRAEANLPCYQFLRQGLAVAGFQR